MLLKETLSLENIDDEIFKKLHKSVDMGFSSMLTEHFKHTFFVHILVKVYKLH